MLGRFKKSKILRALFDFSKPSLFPKVEIFSKKFVDKIDYWSKLNKYPNCSKNQNMSYFKHQEKIYNF